MWSLLVCWLLRWYCLALLCLVWSAVRLSFTAVPQDSMRACRLWPLSSTGVRAHEATFVQYHDHHRQALPAPLERRRPSQAQPEPGQGPLQRRRPSQASPVRRQASQGPPHRGRPSQASPERRQASQGPSRRRESSQARVPSRQPSQPPAGRPGSSRGAYTGPAPPTDGPTLARQALADDRLAMIQQRREEDCFIL